MCIFSKSDPSLNNEIINNPPNEKRNLKRKTDVLLEGEQKRRKIEHKDSSHKEKDIEFNNFPNEVVEIIFSFLNNEQLIRIWPERRSIVMINKIFKERSSLPITWDETTSFRDTYLLCEGMKLFIEKFKQLKYPEDIRVLNEISEKNECFYYKKEYEIFVTTLLETKYLKCSNDQNIKELFTFSKKSLGGAAIFAVFSELYRHEYPGTRILPPYSHSAICNAIDKGATFVADLFPSHSNHREHACLAAKKGDFSILQRYIRDKDNNTLKALYKNNKFILLSSAIGQNYFEDYDDEKAEKYFTKTLDSDEFINPNSTNKIAIIKTFLYLISIKMIYDEFKQTNELKKRLVDFLNLYKLDSSETVEFFKAYDFFIRLTENYSSDSEMYDLFHSLILNNSNIFSTFDNQDLVKYRADIFDYKLVLGKVNEAKEIYEKYLKDYDSYMSLCDNFKQFKKTYYT